MRILHTADWHLGRIFYGRHLTDDQAQVLEICFWPAIKDYKPDVIVLAGDVFDRAVPPVEAVRLWDETITRLASDYKIPVAVIGGNHDSAERLEVGRALMAQCGLHVWGRIDSVKEPLYVSDHYGEVAFCPMPFGEPPTILNTFGTVEANANETVEPEPAPAPKKPKASKKSKASKTAGIQEDSLFGDAVDEDVVETAREAVTASPEEVVAEGDSVVDDYNSSYARAAYAFTNYWQQTVPASTRKVAIGHSMVVGGATCESERPLTIGGTEAIPGGVFNGFNYVALGHLHGPQRVGRDEVRYSGSLMKYSFDEASQDKGMTFVDMNGDGSCQIEQIPLVAPRDVTVLTGSFDELLQDKELQARHKDDYLQIRLTDTTPVIDGMARLRQVFPYTLALELTGRLTGEQQLSEPVLHRLSEQELFERVMAEVRQQPLSDDERQYVNGLWDRILKDDTL